MAKKKNATRADGRIAVQVYIGKDSETGKRHYKTVYGVTQKEADEKAIDVKLSMRRGVDVLAERDTFGDWSERWLRIKETEVSFGMMTAYRSCVKHLSPLKHTPIAKIRAADLQEIVASLYCKNPNTGKAASKKTLTCIKITASQIFQFAIDNRVLDYNPAAAVRIPADAATQTKRALTQEEQRWINDTPHRAQLPAMIMLYSGLRRGELLALTWGDINLGEKTISVNKAVEMINGKPEVKPMTKTASGMRIVYIPSVLVSFLAQQSKTSLLVCPATNERYMSSSSWFKLWNSYLRDLNIKYGNFGNCAGEKKRSKYDPQGVPMMIPRFTAHWLRHTFATMLYFSGVDILTAKEQLGHSDVKTTMGIYTHLDAQYKRRSMGKLDEYLDDASHMQVSGE